LANYVQGSGRFVEDHELWAKRESESDYDTLAHATGQLVRVVFKPGAVHFYQVEQACGAFCALGWAYVGLVGSDYVGELLGHF
jgi:hypothetical protein